MNDRAIELYKQAGATAYELCKKHDIKVESNDTTWTAIMASTLAELVVKECRMVASENFHSCKTAVKLDAAIKEHFGVAE
jgi:hypothetical protein